MKNEDSASESEDLLDAMQRLMIVAVGVLMVMVACLVPLLIHSQHGNKDIVH